MLFGQIIWQHETVLKLLVQMKFNLVRMALMSIFLFKLFITVIENAPAQMRRRVTKYLL